jgi:hypothetical protein
MIAASSPVSGHAGFSDARKRTGADQQNEIHLRDRRLGL